ncbi:MAG: hypothetical protein D6800_12025, partial [Candidatus Zixiibacteriota bacterium]
MTLTRIVGLLCCVVVTIVLPGSVAQGAAYEDLRITDTTAWSTPSGNLRLRAMYSRTVPYGNPVRVEIQIGLASTLGTSVPDSVLFPVDTALLSLLLTDMATGRQVQLQPTSPLAFHKRTDSTRQIVVLRDSTNWTKILTFRVDCDTSTASLSRNNRDSVYTWQRPRVFTVHPSLAAGRYTLYLELMAPSSGEDLWSGFVNSPQFVIAVVDSVDALRQRMFTFPRRLRLREGPYVGWDEEDIDTVTVMTYRHRYLEYRIESAWGDYRTLGLPECPVIVLNRILPTSFVPGLLRLRPRKRIVFVDGRCDLSFHFVLYERERLPGQYCPSFPTSKPQRIWERNLSLTITRNEYDSLRETTEDLYD